MPEFPDLQKLVEKYGSYPQIPDEVWREFDAKCAEMQIKRRNGLPGRGR